MSRNISYISLMCASHFQLSKHVPHELVSLFSCSADGVFGRCQELAGADLYTYDISSSALQRLRILLQKLAHRGTARLPVRLCPSFLFSSLYQSCPGLTANACQLPLCEASQISQAVSLASIAHRRCARTGHLTHIGPLFRHHRLTPAANLIGLYAGRTFRANFVDE